MATRDRECFKSEAEIVKTLRRIFLREIEAARREYAARGGVPLEEARRGIRRR